MLPTSGKSTVRFLSFANDKEDAEKEAKLKEAAFKIEQAIAKEKALEELIDYKPPVEEEGAIDLANDTRPLYERLMEQRNKKKEAVEESQKLSNLVTKLDEEDAYYLNEIAKKKQEEEIKRRLEALDALEDKKRLLEKKQVEEERKMRESLARGKMTSKASSIKSRLSSMIKPKMKTKKTDDEPQIESNKRFSDNSHSIDEVPCDSDRQTRSSTKHAESVSNSDQNVDIRSSSKRQKIETPEKCSDEDGKRNKPIKAGGSCSCHNPNDVMKCIGILPSLPLIEKFVDSSDESSDDGVSYRLVPRIGRRK